jgi:hypothetical protein
MTALGGVEGAGVLAVALDVQVGQAVSLFGILFPILLGEFRVALAGTLDLHAVDESVKADAQQDGGGQDEQRAQSAGCRRCKEGRPVLGFNVATDLSIMEAMAPA